jgi:hypothetical protein
MFCPVVSDERLAPYPTRFVTAKKEFRLVRRLAVHPITGSSDHPIK